MEGLGERIEELLRQHPEVARAVAEVDRALSRTSLARSPLERVRDASAHLRALAGSSASHPRDADIARLVDELVIATLAERRKRER